MYNSAVTGVYIIVIINFTLHVRNLKRRGMQSSDCNSTLKYMHAQFGLKCAEYYYSANNILTCIKLTCMKLFNEYTNAYLSYYCNN